MAVEKPRPAERLVRFLLRLFPFEFRFDHGREIEQTFRAQQRDAERESRTSLWRLWVEFVAGIFQTAPREHVNILRQDAGYALRRMRQNPGFTAIVVITLALGIGANTAIFSIVNGVLLRRLPYGEGDRLVRLRHSAPRIGVTTAGFSEKELIDYRAQSRSLDGVVEYHSMVFILIGSEPHRVQTGVVSPEFFDFFGVRPLHGRLFRADDDQHGGEAVLVLSHPFWQRAFGGDPAVVGRVLQMNNRPHTVIGVLPPLPLYPDENDVYMPVSHCPFRSSPQTRENRRARMVTAFGRLKGGVPLAQAQADLVAVANRMVAEHADAYPKDSGFTVSVTSLKEELTSRAKPTFLILLATAGFVLLIACANVANLSLARMVHREREMAIRTAMGANRGRLLRQLLTESTLLASAGGALGLALASFGLDLLVNFAYGFTPRAGDIRIDAGVLLFALGVSLLTGLIFGSLPALGSRLDLVHSLKEGGAQATPGSARQRARNLLVVSQVAFSLVLLVGAGLMARSLVKLLAVHPGFHGESVLAARVSMNFSKYSDPDINKAQQKQRGFHDEVLRRLAESPGVMAAAVASSYPMSPGGQPFPQRFTIEGRVVADGQPAPRAEQRIVSPDYFRVVGIPLMRGRFFTGHDTAEAERVCIISQSLARHYWGEEDPLGKRLNLNNTPPQWLRVAGVAGDVREFGPGRDAALEVYLPFAQFSFAGRILVRASGDPLQMMQVVREAVRHVDSEVPVEQFRTLEQVRSEAVASPRLTAVLMGLFAALALAITAAGISGVMALSVSQRTHEIGVRMALGATPASVMGMVLKQGMGVVLIGLGLGIAGSLALTRGISELLYGVEPTDPLTFAVVSLVLLGVAAVACLVPARRAATIEPIIALHAE